MNVDNPLIIVTVENVNSSFSVTCSLDLRHIVLAEKNVELHKGHLTMKLRRPRATASIHSSGRIVCTGSTSVSESRVAARRFARRLQKLGYEVKLQNFKVTCVMGSCNMPFAIDLIPFSQKFSSASFVDSVRHHVVRYKIDDLKAIARVHATGYIYVLAPSIKNLRSAIKHIFPLVKACGRMQTKEEKKKYHLRNLKRYIKKYGFDKKL
ncbi:TATA box-binding protein-like 1 [Panulirus ornatus]|uniref:TATA box-binding protein-like 1 n=1 Tax=Panulirus ornatus TaxID=150431 RepID=UPI003A8B0037